MLNSFTVDRKSLPDEPTERAESLSDESIETRETMFDESTETRVSLPVELIEHILSWLPVKSVVRFNIVCKLFHAIIQDPKFIEKHMHHAKIDKTFETTRDPNRPIEVYARINGLILERVRSTRRLQIRNYATNRILQLPELKESVFDGSVSHISHTNEYKVLLAVNSERNSGIEMKVLTVGTDIEWRPIEIPISLAWSKHKVTSLETLKGIHYIVEFSRPDLKQSKMIAFESEDETFMEISMPREVLSSESEFFAIHWEMTIALACRVDDGLSFWVLDYDKKSKWIEEKLVFQTTRDEDLSILKIAKPEYVIEGWLRCHCSGDQPIDVYFHIESHRIHYEVTSVPFTVDNQNTLVSFRGMH